MSAFHLIRAVVFTMGAIVAFAPSAAIAQDQVFPAPNSSEDADGAQFEDAFYISRTDADAARFLNMATFGATATDIAAGQSSLSALHGSTEEEQFHAATRSAA